MFHAFFGGTVLFILLLLFLSLMTFTLALVAYILKGIGLLKICDGLELDCGWMGFLPIFEDYQLGAIAEKEKPSSGTKWSIILLVTGIVQAISASLSGAILSMEISNLIATIGTLTLENALNAFATLLSTPMILGIPLLLSLILPLLYTVLRYVCIGKMYRMYLPGKVTGMMVLTILLPISYPFIVFAIRKKQPIDPATATGRPIGYAV